MSEDLLQLIEDAKLAKDWAKAHQLIDMHCAVLHSKMELEKQSSDIQAILTPEESVAVAQATAEQITEVPTDAHVDSVVVPVEETPKSE